MQFDNSAFRLHELLQSAQNIKPEANNLYAWRQLLQVDNNNKALLLSRMGKMLELPKEISDSLDNNGSADSETTAHISSQLFNAFTTQRFDLKWETFRNKIDIHVFRYLKMASSLLEAKSKTEKIDEQSLEKLRGQILSLIDEFKEANELNVRLKFYVVNQLHILIMVIDDYFITGAQPILCQVESTVGHAFIDPEYRQFLKEDDLGKKLLDCLHTVASATTVALALGFPNALDSIQLLGSIAS